MATLTEPKVVVSAQVSREQREELARRAAAHDRTLSAELRRAVRVYLGGEGSPVERPRRLQEGSR